MQLHREELVMYGGVAFFVALILYDITMALTRRAMWLPSKYLVLYGFILQLAAQTEVLNVSISSAHQQEQVGKLMGKQLSVDSARVTLCVFVGYLLPGLSTTAYRGVWTTMAALLVSLVYHISVENFIAVQSNVIQVGVTRKLSNVDTTLENLLSGDFGRYKEALESLRMPAEDVASLWIANESCFKTVKLSMETAYEEACSCKELIEVFGSCTVEENNMGFFAGQLVEPLPCVKKYFPGLKEPLWSLTAASLLKIIIKVTPDMDHTAVDNAVKAYKQASRLMDLVCCPDNINITVDFFGAANLEAFLVSIASKNAINKVEKMYKQRKGKRGAESAVTLEAAFCSIRQKLEKAERYLRRRHMLQEVPSAGAQGAQWLKMAPKYSNYKVCKLILADSDSYSSVNDLREKLLDSLKDVISSCVLRVPNLLLKSSRHWAAKFEEQKICKAAEIVGKARGLIDAATNVKDGTA
ncbi:hypothetical protein SUGI_0141070 [Cryptomeria japonica]|nr:hypothetical protein SUGI_0141070 [Cryptomeria japonica]